LKGSVETGLYGAAYNFVFGAVFIPYTVSRGLLPRFAACQPGVDLRRAYFRYTGLVVAFLALSSVALLLIVPLFRVVYGSEFQEAEEPYRILVGAFFLIGLTTLNYAVLFSQGRSTVAFGIASAGLTTNVVANLVLIPDLAATGAALSMILSEVVVLSAQAVALTQLMSSSSERHTRAVESHTKTAA
jgi:O-antigen/teichoic acid export membrane protein